jgi:type IV fimbrial biogenesis protein FimT
MRHLEKTSPNYRHMAYPFVCLFMPFVCTINPIVTPFIGINIPFVRNKGFTLIELVITMTVVGILAAIAVPSYQGFINSNRLTAATNEFMGDISFARVESMKRQAGNTGKGQVVVCVSTNGTSCAASPATWTSGWISFWDQDGDNSFNTANGDVLLKIHDSLSSNMTTVTLPNGTEVLLAFNRLGVLLTPMTSLQITNTKINQNRLICLSGGTGRAMIAQQGAACP